MSTVEEVQWSFGIWDWRCWELLVVAWADGDVDAVLVPPRPAGPVPPRRPFGVAHSCRYTENQNKESGRGPQSSSLQVDNEMYGNTRTMDSGSATSDGGEDRCRCSLKLSFVEGSICSCCKTPMGELYNTFWNDDGIKLMQCTGIVTAAPIIPVPRFKKV